MTFKEKSVMFFATGCFIGNAPLIPGTVGSLWGIPMHFLLEKLHMGLAVLTVVFFIFISIWIASEAEKILKRNDPGCIVIDEIVGMTITLVGLSATLPTIITGFILFRLFDILKPFPIRFIEKSLKGGTGVVLDDVAAGFASNMVIRAMILITGYPN